MSFMPLDARAQDNLLNDVRGLIAEYAQSVNAPLDPAVLADSGVEIVSEQTLSKAFLKKPLPIQTTMHSQNGSRGHCDERNGSCNRA